MEGIRGAATTQSLNLSTEPVIISSLLGSFLDHRNIWVSLTDFLYLKHQCGDSHVHLETVSVIAVIHALPCSSISLDFQIILQHLSLAQL